MVGSVVAPTTMLTALLIYFGWAYSANFVEYFGLDYSLMGFTTQDYVIGSVQVLFRPLAMAFSAGMLMAWAQARLGTRLFAAPDAPRLLRRAAWVSSLSGMVLFAMGLAGVFISTWKARGSVWLPLCFGAGAVLLAYGSRLSARSERSAGATTGARGTALLEVTAAFFLVSLSLFWAATNYAADVGRANAAVALNGEYLAGPDALLYSKEPLYLDAPGVRETSCDPAAGGYRFRYEGLRLMIQSGGHYFFLPATWSRDDGVAVVVPKNEAVRIQFTVAPRNGAERIVPPAMGCPSS